jgi:hypothetical protein
LLLCVHPRVAQAERGLIAPHSDRPARVVPGALLALTVEVATGLTPPPGVQEDRAHRAFALSLCADGLDLGAGRRRCFPLPVHNVRPCDAISLRYRVEARVPDWLAPSRYDLSLRFPGGQAHAPGALVVAHVATEPIAEAAGESVAAGLVMEGGAQGRRVRVHVGETGMQLQGARFEAYPIPDASGFAPGFVGLIQVPPGGRGFVTKRQETARFPLAIAPLEAELGRLVTLRLRGAPARSQVFWWLGARTGGRGSAFTTRFLYPGKQAVQVLAVSHDGRVGLLSQSLPIWQRRALGCSLAAPGTPSAAVPYWVGLLVLSRWWKLRAARSRRRRELC